MSDVVMFAIASFTIICLVFLGGVCMLALSFGSTVSYLLSGRGRRRMQNGKQNQKG